VIVEAVDSSITRELRRRVLRPTWAPGSPMPGDAAPGAIHLAARDPVGAVVGACVLFPNPYPRRPDEPAAWQLRGMATAEDRRGRGIGAAILTEAVRRVAGLGGRLLWCEARETAVPFYARHGFVGEGDLHVNAETGIPHLLMLREPVLGVPVLGEPVLGEPSGEPGSSTE
jgi:predicted GNAT family N-acyltransferase